MTLAYLFNVTVKQFATEEHSLSKLQLIGKLTLKQNKIEKTHT